MPPSLDLQRNEDPLTELLFRLAVIVGGGSFRRSAMKFRLLPLAASIVLIGSLGAAAAADHNAMSKQSSMSSTASMAKDNLTLTTAQEKLAWRDLSKQAASQRAPSTFSASAGTTVPNDITLRPIPRKVASQLPTLKPYRYARLSNELLIVNPTDKKVVDVIKRHA
jgi:hypothetical protein